ncbi:MAG: type II toxin-antitoxin system HicB family antitoxin [Thermoanaerobaculia bacterium]
MTRGECLRATKPTGRVKIPPLKLRVVLEFDPEAGGWSAVCPELPAGATAGDSQEEALKKIREAIALSLSPDDPVPDDATVVELTI